MANPIDVGTDRIRRSAAVARGPHIDLRITGVIREGCYEITALSECERLHVGDRLLGSYLAPDQASLHVAPSSTVATAVSERQLEREPGPGGTWELDTSNMRPRNYTLSLRISDRSQVEASRCYGLVSVDFRLSGARAR